MSKRGASFQTPGVLCGRIAVTNFRKPMPNLRYSKVGRGAIIAEVSWLWVVRMAEIVSG